MGYSAYPPFALNPNLQGNVAPVDFIDGDGFIPTGPNIIPRSSAAPLEIVNALASDVTEIQVISDIGEFVVLYRDLAKTQKIAEMVLTPDETVKVALAAGDSVFMSASKDVDIDQPGSFVAMNFNG